MIKELIKLLLGNKPKADILQQEEHRHEWEFRYRTGNAKDGKSEVCECACGKWSVRHFGESERHILK